MINLGALSYGAAAVGWALLFLLLLTSWRGRLQGGLLVAAVLINLLWALRASYYAAAQAVGLDWLYQLLEVARNVAWLLFLMHLLEPLVREMGAFCWLRWAGTGAFRRIVGCHPADAVFLAEQARTQIVGALTSPACPVRHRRPG